MTAGERPDIGAFRKGDYFTHFMPSTIEAYVGGAWMVVARFNDAATRDHYHAAAARLGECEATAAIEHQAWQEAYDKWGDAEAKLAVAVKAHRPPTPRRARVRDDDAGGGVANTY